MHPENAVLEVCGRDRGTKVAEEGGVGAMEKAHSNLYLPFLLLALACTISKNGYTEPGDVFKLDVPIISEPPPQVRDLKDGDATVATQTGVLHYSFPIEVPPGRL